MDALWNQVHGLIDQVQRVPTAILLTVAAFFLLSSAVLVIPP